VENASDAVDDAQTTVLVNTFSACSLAPTTDFKGQLTGGVLNPTTGQPVSRGRLLAVAGGNFFQHLVNYLTTQSLLPVYEVWDSTNQTVAIMLRKDGSKLRQLATANMGSTRDLVVIEVGVDPITGTPTLVAFGADQGTPAAAWYFSHFVMTDASAGTKTWFVCDWTDLGTAGPDASDTWDCISG
jgi:hypothetical protein